MRRPIVRLGHPILRFPAAPVNVDDLKEGDLEDLFRDLRETLEDSRASALTAPQLGMELQILAVGSRVLVDLAAKSDTLIIVNPMLEPEHGDLVYDWESCLSIPDLKGLVPRHPTVRLRGVDDQGEPIDLVAKGEAARILQHAHDHLSGVVFLDRMRDLRSLAFGDEWREFLTGTGVDDSKGEATH